MPEYEDLQRTRMKAMPWYVRQFAVGRSTFTLCLHTREFYVFPFCRNFYQEGWYFCIGEFVLVRERLIKWMSFGVSIITPMGEKEKEAWIRKKT